MISRNYLLNRASGRLGNIVVKHYDDLTVITTVPDMSRRKLSAKQKEANERMQLAILSARHITGHPERKQRACELLQVPANKVFRAIVKEYLLTDGKSSLFQETEPEKRERQALAELKNAILTELPDAELCLFGEKAKNPGMPSPHWDLLALTKQEHPPLQKWQLQEKLQAITMPLGMQANMLLVQKEKWVNAAEYEELRKRIAAELVVLS